MDEILKKFSEKIKGEDADKLVKKAKEESAERLLAQGVSSMALYMSQLMMKSLEADDKLLIKTSA